MFETLLLILLLLASAYWLDSIKARETAINKGQELAARTQLQLLDETVACSRLWFARNHKGHLQLQRTYDFEVSANGADRLQCQLTLLGKQLQSWHIPPYLQAVH
jgi:hypothetical protein